MFRSTAIALLIIFRFSIVQAQQQTIDSLKTLLQNPKLHDTTRIKVMEGIVENNFILGNPDADGYSARIKAILDKRLAQNNLNAAERKAFQFSLGNWYFNEAAKIFATDDGRQAIRYFDLSCASFKKAGADQEYWMVVANKGLALRKLNRSDEAFDCFFAALRHYEQVGDAAGVASVNTAIGLAYAELDDFPKAITHYENAARYFAGLKKRTAADDYEYMNVLGSLGVAYKQVGQKAKARKLFHQEMQISEATGGTKSTAYALRSLADLDIDEHKYEDAIAKYQKGLSISDDIRTRSYLLLGLWEAYFKTGRASESLKFALEAQSNAKLLKEPTTTRDVYNALYQTYKVQKNFAPALEMHEKYKAIQDSMDIGSAKDQLARQQLKYAYEKKELKLKLDAEKKNAAKNNWLIALSGLLLLIVLAGVFYYRNNKQKQAIAGLEKSQIKQKLLITQMNPHFIFNSVQNIRNLIDRHKNDDAVKYLDQFSVLTRQILENSNENYISLEEEVAMIKNYLSIQQLLYNHKFDYTIIVEDDIETDSVFLPPMLTQPFIENAIKHGLSNTETNGMIDIRFFFNAGKLFFEVTDNGKGFDTKSVSNHKSLAMTITRERLVGYTKNQDFIVLTDNVKDRNENVVGAKVRFEIPYIYEN